MVQQRKNVLIIGGAGFIGSHLCDKLVQTCNVICVDNFISSNQNNIAHLLRNFNFEFIKHDINQPLNLESNEDIAKFQIEVHGIQEVYNLACPTSPKEFENLKIETLHTNSLGVTNALDLAVKYKAKFLHFSSSVVYGDYSQDNKFLTEDYVGPLPHLDPRACYDEGKKFAEAAVQTYRDIYKIDAKIVRIFRTYGPRMQLGHGQMTPDFIMDALDDKDLVIYGDESFETSLCFVSDVVEGCIKVLESNLTKPINIGSTDVYKVVDVANKVISMTGSNSKIKFEKPLLFMRPLGFPNLTMAKEELGWFPIVTLEDGLEKTIDYTRANKDILQFEIEKEEKKEKENEKKIQI